MSVKRTVDCKEMDNRLRQVKVGANKEIQMFLNQKNSSSLKTAASLAELISRPELSYERIAEIDTDRPCLPKDVIEQININLKYDGYIKRQLKQVEQFQKIENKKIAPGLDYNEIKTFDLRQGRSFKNSNLFLWDRHPASAA